MARFYISILAALTCIVAFCTLYAPVCHAFTVGVVLTRETPFYEKIHEAFLDHLRGSSGGQKIDFIIQRPLPDPVAWSNTAKKLIAADVDAIVTYGTSATIAAINESKDTPIIYAGAYLPAMEDSPSRNATGICSRVSINTLLRYIKSSANTNHLAVLYCSVEKDSALQTSEVVELAKKYDIETTTLNLRKAADVSQVMSGVEPGYFLITSSSTISTVYPTILRMSTNKMIPTASLLYHTSTPTILMSPSTQEQGKNAADRLLKVIKGVMPKDIPNTCSKEIDLVFNLKEANAMGLKIPMDLVTGATRLIN